MTLLRLTLVMLVCCSSAPAQGNAPSRVRITLTRGGCLGSCPVYMVVVRGDGSVRYEGKSFVHIRGVRTKRISRDTVRRLVKEFTNSNFFGLGVDYPIFVDAPMVTVSFCLNGRCKEVKEGCACPAEVVNLEQAVDRTAGTKRWVHTGWLAFLHLD
jgi:hypothetical protein